MRHLLTYVCSRLNLKQLEFVPIFPLPTLKPTGENSAATAELKTKGKQRCECRDGSNSARYRGASTDLLSRQRPSILPNAICRNTRNIPVEQRTYIQCHAESLQDSAAQGSAHVQAAANLCTRRSARLNLEGFPHGTYGVYT